MPFVSREDDPGLLDTYRKQLRTARDAGLDLEVVFLMWVGQEGVSRDSLIDVYEQETGAKPVQETRPPTRGRVQPSPFK